MSKQTIILLIVLISGLSCRKFVWDNSNDTTNSTSDPASLNNGLVAYYPFNVNANDESGNGNNGTVNGATLTTDRFGSINKAYNFNGFSNFISINATLGNFGINNFSISSWIYVNDLVNGVIVGKRSSAGYGNFFEQTWVSGPYVELNESNVSDYFLLGQSSESYLNKWSHYVLVRNGTLISIYMDGILIKSRETSKLQYINNTVNLLIGARYVNFALTEYFKGKLDDIRIYNRALTQEEITYLATH